MPASIRVTLHSSPGGPVVGPITDDQSRDDLRKGYQVVVESVYAAASYNWTLSFAPQSSGPTAIDPNAYDGTPSSAGLLPPEGSTSQTAKFNVDWDGSYLIRLVTDAGIPGVEAVEFVRLRVLTKFGKIKLVAAGERRDEKGIIPVDASPEGWANDQNQNLQRLMTLVRRMSVSGRILYVDPNRGRDTFHTQNDPDNILRIPGSDGSFINETGIRIAAEGFADFYSINDAIGYAMLAASRGEPAPSMSNPYWILIQPGYYEENLVLRPHIHLCANSADFTTALISGPGGISISPIHIRTTSAVDAHHQFVTTGSFPSDFVILKGIELENIGGTTYPVLRQAGGGVFCFNSSIIQYGTDAAQGPAVHIENSATLAAFVAIDSSVDNWSDFATPTNYAMIVDNPTAIVVGQGAHIAGSSGILVNPQAASSASLDFSNSTFPVACMTGKAIEGFPSDLGMEFCSVANPSMISVPVIEIYAPIGTCSFPASWRILNSIVLGHLIVEAGGTTDVTELLLSGSTHNEVIFPTAPGNQPTVFHASEMASTIRYVPNYHKPEAGPAAPCPIPVPNRLPVGNVQDAIDLLVQYVLPFPGAPFHSLDTAYDGLAILFPPTPGSGLGRTIIADFGAVQITGATPPLGLETDGLLRGGLQMEGVLDLGPVVTDGWGSEVNISPDPFGGGPFAFFGREIYPSCWSTVHSGFPAATFVAGNANVPTGEPGATVPYNYITRTRNNSDSPTTELGRVVIDGGTSYLRTGDVTPSPSGGNVYIQGGSNLDPNVSAFDGGYIWLAPGRRDTPTGTGAVRIVNSDASTRASLLAANVYAGGGAHGSVWFSTPNGLEKFDILAGDNLAAVIATINAQSLGIFASNSAGKLKLECLTHGPNGDVLYVGDSTSGTLNTKLGNMLCPGAVFTPGTFPEYVDISCDNDGELHVHGTLVVDGGIALSPIWAYQSCVVANPLGQIFAVGAASQIIGVDTTIGVATIRLPAAPATGRVVVVKDESGTAALNNISVVPDPATPAMTIDLLPPPFVMNVPKSSFMFYYNGASWFLM